MKKFIIFIYATMVAFSLFADNSTAASDLANSPGIEGDVARAIIKYPALPGELPSETEGRRALLVMMDDLRAQEKLTAELERSIRKQIADILTAETARMQVDAQSRKPVHVIIDNH